MKKKPKYFANWKLNHNFSTATDYVQLFKKQIKLLNLEEDNYVFFPPALCSAAFYNQELNWGGQNISEYVTGAFTGENSINGLKDMGASYVLVGHSERRVLFYETDELVNRKVLNALANDIKPVICVGENLQQRDKRETLTVIKKQLTEALKSVNSESDFVIAYEPVWAIGTGKIALPEQAQEVHSFIRRRLMEWGYKSDTILLYGGSVKAENSLALSNQEDIDGFLIGGASLKVDSLLAIN